MSYKKDVYGLDSSITNYRIYTNDKVYLNKLKELFETGETNLKENEILYLIERFCKHLLYVITPINIMSDHDKYVYNHYLGYNPTSEYKNDNKYLFGYKLIESNDYTRVRYISEHVLKIQKMLFKTI